VQITRRCLIALSVAATFAVPAVPAAAQPRFGYDEPTPPTACTIERLAEQPGWPLSIVTGADRTGRYILGRGYPADPFGDFTRFPVIWFNGVPTMVDVPGIDQSLADINALGVAVGFSFDPLTWEPMAPWVYRGGEVTALPGVTAGDARGINDRGDIAGNRSGGDGAPVWWPAAGGGPVDLSVPAGAVGAEAHDIDEDGTVIGSYQDAEFVDRGYAWRPDGTTMEVPLPPGYGPSSRAFQVRNGWVIGITSGPEAGFVGFRWHLPTGEVEAFPQFDSRPDAVNAAGWLVGPDPAGKGLLVTDEGQLSLPGLTDHGEPLGDIPTALSDGARTIAGQALDAAGDIRAVRWVCG
jgi:hypothetical protein